MPSLGESAGETSRRTSTKSNKDSRPSSANEHDGLDATKAGEHDAASEKGEDGELDLSQPLAVKETDCSRPMSATEDDQMTEKKNPDLSSEDLRRIHELFNLFDEDKSGSMSSAELGKLMRSLGDFHHFLISLITACCTGMFPTDREVEALVSSMDEDKSGQIELDELVQHMGLQVTSIVIKITVAIAQCAVCSVRCPCVQNSPVA